MGEPFPNEVVRAAMLLRANALAKGYSGVRLETIELLDRSSTPVSSRSSRHAARWEPAATSLPWPISPCRLSARARRGRGGAVTGAEALDAAGLHPVTLGAKEGLALINGTQFMAAIGALVLIRAGRLVRIADLACAMSVEALRGSRMPFRRDPAARPHPGQADSPPTFTTCSTGSDQRVPPVVRAGTGRLLASLLAPGARRRPRCVRYVEGVVAIELNAATDNPLVFAEGEVLSNGNFHGEPVAIALDTLTIALAELAGISERRIERMVNPTMSEGLPPFLTEEGLNSGFMSSTTWRPAWWPRTRRCATRLGRLDPHLGRAGGSRVDGTAPGRALLVVCNVERVLAVELLAGAQAVEFLAPLEPGIGVRAARIFVRTLSERVREDRSLSADIERVADAIRDGGLLAAVERELPEALP